MCEYIREGSEITRDGIAKFFKFILGYQHMHFDDWS
jgi:hypothetical protein